MNVPSFMQRIVYGLFSYCDLFKIDFQFTLPSRGHDYRQRAFVRVFAS